MGDTELAHLLEHVTVELLAQTDAAGDVMGGQTVEIGERTYKITLACPDDVLVAGALSSAVWILQWAYSGGGEPEPDVEAIASGLVDLVDSLGDSSDEDLEPVDELADNPVDEPLEEVAYEEESVVSEFVDAAYEPIADDEPGEWDQTGDLSAASELPAEEPPADDFEPVEEDLEEPSAYAEPADDAATEPVEDPPEQPEDEAEPEDEPDSDSEEEPVDDDPWGMKDIPRPHLVR